MTGNSGEGNPHILIDAKGKVAHYDDMLYGIVEPVHDFVSENIVSLSIAAVAALMSGFIGYFFPHRRILEKLDERLALPEKSHLEEKLGPDRIEIGNVYGDLVLGNKGSGNSHRIPTGQYIRYGTKYGDLHIRLDSVKQTTEDIRDWLIEHRLHAGLRKAPRLGLRGNSRDP